MRNAMPRPTAPHRSIPPLRPRASQPPPPSCVTGDRPGLAVPIRRHSNDSLTNPVARLSRPLEPYVCDSLTATLGCWGRPPLDIVPFPVQTLASCFIARVPTHHSSIPRLQSWGAVPSTGPVGQTDSLKQPSYHPTGRQGARRPGRVWPDSSQGRGGGIGKLSSFFFFFSWRAPFSVLCIRAERSMLAGDHAATPTRLPPRVSALACLDDSPSIILDAWLLRRWENLLFWRSMEGVVVPPSPSPPPPHLDVGILRARGAAGKAERKHSAPRTSGPGLPARLNHKNNPPADICVEHRRRTCANQDVYTSIWRSQQTSVVSRCQAAQHLPTVESGT